MLARLSFARNLQKVLRTFPAAEERTRRVGVKLNFGEIGAEAGAALSLAVMIDGVPPFESLLPT